MAVIEKTSIKKLIRDAVTYFVLALGCLAGADYVVGTWHDVLLVVAGLMLGGVAAMVTLIDIETKRRAKDREAEQPGQGS